MKSSKSDKAPIRFWIPWILACQAIVPSGAWGGVVERAGFEFGVVVVENGVVLWREGWVVRMMDIRIVCGIRRIMRGK